MERYQWRHLHHVIEPPDHPVGLVRVVPRNIGVNFSTLTDPTVRTRKKNSNKKKFKPKKNLNQICEKKNLWVSQIPGPMPESTHYAYVGCLSLDRHIHATEYEEVLAFCKANGYYYAVKAEDTNPISEMGWTGSLEEVEGKVHCHWLQIREFATYSHDTKDRRYGAIKKSHLRENFFKMCPAISAAVSNSQFSQKFAVMFSQMTSDHAACYYSKESLLKSHNLPDDLVVLRPYISLKTERQYNPEDDAHVNTYKTMQYPIPATMQSVWDYLTTRWYTENNCKRVKMEQHQIQQAKNLYHAINETQPELPKALQGFDSETLAPKRARTCECTYELYEDALRNYRQALYKRKYCLACNSLQ